MSAHRCPCTACEDKAADGELMCAAHWLMVPRFLRDDVRRYWKQTDTSDVSARRLAFHNYGVARDAAIAAVNAQLAPVIH